MNLLKNKTWNIFNVELRGENMGVYCSFFLLLFIYYLERASQVNSLKAVSFSSFFLLFNLFFNVYLFLFCFCYLIINYLIFIYLLFIIFSFF